MKNALACLVMCLLMPCRGQSQTPYLLKDIISGPVGGFAVSSQYSYYDHPFEVVWEHNGNIFFTAVNYSTVPNGGSYTNDVELWKSDGTPGGTVLVKDINPGNDGSYPADFKEINGILYFTAYSSASGRELWKTDGTNAGTIIVKEIVAGNVGGFQQASQYNYYDLPFSVVWQDGGVFYFVANNYSTVPNGGSYTNNPELWKSDGTDAGTMMVKEINPGNDGSSPSDFHVISNTLYFTAWNPASGRELWKSDGTNGGTVIVKELINGTVGGFEISGQWGYEGYTFTVVWQNGGVFYFVANNYASPPGTYINDLELFRSDGTSSGTYMVKDIEPGNVGSYPQYFYNIGGTLYFTARTTASGRELWKSDGSNGGTVLVKEIINGAVGGFEESGQWDYYDYAFNVVWQNGNVFYFNANNYASPPGTYINDIELFRSDGTQGGTYMVKDIQPGNDGSNPRDFNEINGTLFFTARTTASGRELWKTDGTNVGTVLIKEIINGTVGGFEESGQFGYYDRTFSVVWQNGGTFYFNANNNASAPGGNYNDIELFQSDGTWGGTYMVKDIYAGNNGSYPMDFKVMNGNLYFTAHNNISGRELWKSDGTNGGTVLVSEIMNGNVGGFETASQYAYYAWPFSVAFNIGGSFYFTANDYASVPNGGSYDNNIELWKSDGTSGGTSKVLEIYPGNTTGSYPMHYTSRLGKIFFTATNAANGRELWVLDVPVSVEEPPGSRNDWTIYPNPAGDRLHVYSESMLSDPLAGLTIRDINGRVILQSSPTGSQTGAYRHLDTSRLTPGIYLVQFTSGTLSETKKFVKW